MFQSFNSGLVTALALTFTAVKAEFNMTTCPAYWEIQQANVVESFEIERYSGFFYELAFHDVTQFPMCPMVSCVTVDKYFSQPDMSEMKEFFTLDCFGEDYSLTNTYWA